MKKRAEARFAFAQSTEDSELVARIHLVGAAARIAKPVVVTARLETPGLVAEWRILVKQVQHADTKRQTLEAAVVGGHVIYRIRRHLAVVVGGLGEQHA